MALTKHTSLNERNTTAFIVTNIITNLYFSNNIVYIHNLYFSNNIVYIPNPHL